MPAAKRINPAPAASPAKKPKKNSLAAKCGVIEEAIHQAQAAGLASLTATAAASLSASLPFSLGQPKEERHKFQEETVDMVGQVLDLHKASLEEQLKTCRSEIEQAERRRDELQVATQQRQSELDEARDEANKLKGGLADNARTFQAAKAAVNEAERLAEKAGEELNNAAFRKAEVDKLRQDMDHLHQDQGGRRLKDFATRVERYVDADTSMLTAIPCVFSKEPSARGQFDLMVVEQLTEKVNKAMVGIDEVIKGGAAAEAEHAASVEAAEAALLQARKKQIEAARAYTEASGAAKLSEEAAQKVRGDVKQLSSMYRKATQRETDAQFDIDLFCQKVLETFAELRDRAAVAEDALTEAPGSPAPVASPNVAAGSPSLATVQVAVEVVA
jgi:hypothetical protein